MVTTRELIALAKKKSKEIGKEKAKEKREIKAAEKELKEAEKIAMIQWKEKMAKGKKKEKRKKKIAKAIYKPMGRLKPADGSKAIKKLLSRFVEDYKKRTRPIATKKRPMRRPIPKRRILRHPRDIPMPNSVRELQNVRNLRRLLTRQEQIEVDRIFSGSQRAAAMQILRRRLKEQQINRERSNPRIIYKRDIMTGKTTIQKKIPTERWLM